VMLVSRVDFRTWMPNLRSDDDIHRWRTFVLIPYCDDTRDVLC
jgi:hypothetical protein